MGSLFGCGQKTTPGSTRNQLPQRTCPWYDSMPYQSEFEVQSASRNRAYNWSSLGAVRLAYHGRRPSFVFVHSVAVWWRLLIRTQKPEGQLHCTAFPDTVRY